MTDRWQLCGLGQCGFQQSHGLVDDNTDPSNRLISIGSTNDPGTFTNLCTYFRPFSIRLAMIDNNDCNNDARSEAVTETEEAALTNQLVIYPNPVQNQLVLAGC